MQSYRDLRVWREAIVLVVDIYRCTSSFPNAERYGLTGQLRRAAVSIPSNIAEGYCREHRAEYIRFLKIAYASGGELQTQLIIAEKLRFLPQATYQNAHQNTSRVMGMLYKLINSLRL